jgi:hypothetical protein
MRNFKIYAIACCFFASFSALADFSDCSGDAAHCLYLTGLSKNNLLDGRYLKYELHINGKVHTLVECDNNSTTLTVDQEDAAKISGASIGVSICEDQNGKNCRFLGWDSFVIIKQNGTYSSQPPSFGFDLSAVKDLYPVCNPGANKKTAHGFKEI